MTGHTIRHVYYLSTPMGCLLWQLLHDAYFNVNNVAIVYGDLTLRNHKQHS